VKHGREGVEGGREKMSASIYYDFRGDGEKVKSIAD
jgi:hypothetical protein